jgi:hypothetical protein
MERGANLMIEAIGEATEVTGETERDELKVNREVTAVTVYIVDYDLPANNSRRRFYRHIQAWLRKHNIDEGTDWSTQSVIITVDEEFAEFVYAQASQVGRVHMYKAKKIK